MVPAAKVAIVGSVPLMNSLPVPVKATVKFLTGAMVLLTVKLALPPSATVLGLTLRDTTGTSLSSIMPSPAKVIPLPCKAAPMALERVRVSTSGFSSSMSSVTSTSMNRLV